MVVFLLHLLANGNEISNALDVIGMRSVDLLIQFQGCWVCTHTSITWSDHQSPFHFVRFNLGSSRKEGDGSLVVCGDWWFHGGMFDLFYYIYIIYIYICIPKNHASNHHGRKWDGNKKCVFSPSQSLPSSYNVSFWVLCSSLPRVWTSWLSFSGLIHLLFHVVDAQPCDHIHINWPIPVGFQVVVKGLGLITSFVEEIGQSCQHTWATFKRLMPFELWRTLSIAY